MSIIRFRTVLRRVLISTNFCEKLDRKKRESSVIFEFEFLNNGESYNKILLHAFDTPHKWTNIQILEHFGTWACCFDLPRLK